MSSEAVVETDPDVAVEAESTKSPTESKKRPRLDFSAGAEGRERKRGKSMFGLLVGTLNKAKLEDKERNASDAAKKRQIKEQSIQAMLRKQTDSVRRAEDAKKDKTTANRKEEDLQLKDSIYKLRRTRLPLLANFLLTSDIISSEDYSSTNPLAPVPRSHPPPLYYLPAILLPSQETFLSKRKEEVSDAVEKEWQLFSDERRTGIEEVRELRQRVAEEEARRKSEKKLDKDDMDTDMQNNEPNPEKVTDMEVDEASGTVKEEQKNTTPTATNGQDKKDEQPAIEADDDDVVEY